ncbi:hypothetical protein HPP92_020052 [Vanilla planifolia]|uniref:Fe2OG dioxygenase domain-containing protein n=1 Tax=Vanilla planifolia TaxID=51239 RepID=A0A835Q7P4_VANPL|nr:hypothetical protein HPP92_020052 [Vanilla planifolia]
MAATTSDAAAARTTALKCISLLNPDIQKSCFLLKQACQDSGFFFVVDHGISQDLTDEVFFQSKMFFGLPLQEKMKLLRNKKHRGYTPKLDELLDPENQVITKKDITLELRYLRMIIKQTNLFMGQISGPQKMFYLGGGMLWRSTIEKPYADFFDKKEMLDEPIATLRLLHYEDKVSDPAMGIYGCGAHSDFGFLTLLATDDVMGLQICKDKDARPRIWEYVPPLKGAFVVNLGDMLERWSNGVFRSTLHRVIGHGQERYSIVYFVEPSHECIVECLPSCTSEVNPPKYSPIICSTYLSQRYRETHLYLDSYHRNEARGKV